MAELLYKEEVYAIVGAAMAVYNTLGSGFLEAVYQESLAFELASRNIPYEEQKELRICYRGHWLAAKYRADFVTYDKIIVEIKALDHLTSREEAQLLNYLNATGMQLGLLLNFGADGKLEWKRMVYTKPTPYKIPNHS